MSEFLRKGLISSIESYTVHDGPGCRTTVFLSGCPLKCEWCANPETWEMKQKLMFYAGKCQYEKGCISCLDKCKAGGLVEKEDKIVLDWDKCRKCKDINCAKYCKHEALKKCGTYYSVEELMKVVERDRFFWGDDGGITFSGGEPLLQHEFLIEMLKSCKEEYIHTAIETTAYTDSEVFLNVIPFLDFMFIDVKHMDPLKHKEKTKVSNEQILKNIGILSQKISDGSWCGRLVLRVPVIEGFNDTPENINLMADYMEKKGLFEVNLLPFHNLGDSKWSQLGKAYVYNGFGATKEEKMMDLYDIFDKRGISCYLGSDTVF